MPKELVDIIIVSSDFKNFFDSITFRFSEDHKQYSQLELPRQDSPRTSKYIGFSWMGSYGIHVPRAIVPGYFSLESSIFWRVYCGKPHQIVFISIMRFTVSDADCGLFFVITVCLLNKETKFWCQMGSQNGVLQGFYRIELQHHISLLFLLSSWMCLR